MNENYIDINEEVEQNPKRPVFLTVLCVLSFITLGFGMLSLVFSLMMGQPSTEEIESVSNQYIQTASTMRDQNALWAADLMEKMADLTILQNDHFMVVQLINTIMILTGFIGVLFMFRGRRLGFHFYIIYNLLSIGGVYLVAPFNMVPNIILIMGLIFSGLFIFLYSRNLKWMTK